MRFAPLGDRVLVKQDEAQAVTPGGIHLPDAAKEKPRRGKVVAKGAGKRRDDGTFSPIPVDEGNMVYYAAYTGNQLTLDGEEFLVIETDSILGVMTK